MPIELKMPALSPTMEEGTLAKWLVKEGDEVKSGDILAEIETDKATMEFEAVDEGKIAKILVAEGTDGVKVGAPIALIAGEGESVDAAAAPKADAAPAPTPKATPTPKADVPSAPAANSDRDAGSSAPAGRTTARRRGPDQGFSARSPPRAGAEHRPFDPAGHWAWWSRHPCRRRCGGGKGSCTGYGRRANRCGSTGARHPCRHARTDRAGDPARSDQAVERPQDHCASTDGIEAADPAHLSDASISSSTPC